MWASATRSGLGSVSNPGYLIYSTYDVIREQKLHPLDYAMRERYFFTPVLLDYNYAHVYVVVVTLCPCTGHKGVTSCNDPTMYMCML